MATMALSIVCNLSVIKYPKLCFVLLHYVNSAKAGRPHFISSEATANSYNLEY